MAFTRKYLVFTFDLGQGAPTFQGGANRLRVAGLRASALIMQAGGAGLGQTEVAIYGMTLDNMNKLSTLGQLATYVRRSALTIEAGDDQKGLAIVFQGTIYQAWADFGGMPQVLFRVTAQAGLYAAVKPIPPSTFSGSADVTTILAGLAPQDGRVLENFGVNGVFLHDAYFPGTVLDQIKKVCTAANINFSLDNPEKLTIWPKNGSVGKLIPLISPETGMIGFPTFTSVGIEIQTLYNPALQVGLRVKVESSLTPACGEWIISQLVHTLDTMMPAGQWSSRFIASPPGYTVIPRGR